MEVKICGLTNLEDTLAAVELGADYLGFNFYPDSPRFVDPFEVQGILQEIPPNIQKVGVFVNEDPQRILDIICDLQLDWVQFHGDETAEYCNPFGHPWMKAFRLKEEKDLTDIPLFECDQILVDAWNADQYGGSGQKGNWSLAREAKKFGKKIILAGGLNPENVQKAIVTVQPDAVDVASGVESRPGKKDFQRMEQFIEKAKQIALRLIEGEKA